MNKLIMDLPNYSVDLKTNRILCGICKKNYASYYYEFSSIKLPECKSCMIKKLIEKYPYKPISSYRKKVI